MGDSVFFRNLIENASVIVLLLVALMGGAKRWWVFGWTYQAMVEDRDEWRRIALDGARLVDRGAEVAETALRVAERRGNPR